MRRCAHCQTTYPPGVLVCPRDSHPTAEAPSEANPNHKFLGRYVGSYQIISALGEGGMGAVYAAEHPTLKKKVAVKILHEEFAKKSEVIDRFFVEARLIAALGHPNLVEVSDFGVLDNIHPYFVMEFLSGESLKDKLEREHCLSPRETLAIAQQLLDALSVIHEEGIVHRDIKPDNVYLARKPKVSAPVVKLLDFGVAKLLDQSIKPEGAKNTRSGMIIGTPHYMSPEQIQGYVSRVDPRSDLYSVGVLFYEMLCGQLPFPGNTFGELVIAHVMNPPPRARTHNPKLPQELEDFLQKALAKEREARFQSAAEMFAALCRATEAAPADWGIPSSALATIESRGAASWVVQDPKETAKLRKLPPTPPPTPKTIDLHELESKPTEPPPPRAHNTIPSDGPEWENATIPEPTIPSTQVATTGEAEPEPDGGSTQPISVEMIEEVFRSRRGTVYQVAKPVDTNTDPGTLPPRPRVGNTTLSGLTGEVHEPERPSTDKIPRIKRPIPVAAVALGGLLAGPVIAIALWSSREEPPSAQPTAAATVLPPVAPPVSAPASVPAVVVPPLIQLKLPPKPPEGAYVLINGSERREGSALNEPLPLAPTDTLRLCIKQKKPKCEKNIKAIDANPENLTWPTTTKNTPETSKGKTDPFAEAGRSTSQ